MRVKKAGRILIWSNGRKRVSKKHRNTNSGEQTVYTLTKKIKRRRRVFLKLLYRLEKDPKWFITLIYPYEKRKISELTIKNDIKRLSDSVRRRFPKGWFIYVIEWKRKAGIHIHIIGRKGSKYPEIKKLLPMWWHSITKCKEYNLCVIRYLNNKKHSDSIIGYLTKPAKRRFEFVALKKIGEKKNTFGIINKRNLKLSKEISYSIKNQQLRQMILADIEKLEKATGKEISQSHKNQVLYSKCGFHIINDESIFPISE